MAVHHWIKDTRGHFLSCSEGVAELAGVDSPQSLIGKSDFDLIWSNRAVEHLKEEKIALSCREHQQLQIQHTNQGMIKILVNKTPLYGKSNKIYGTMGSSINITEYLTNTRPQKNDLIKKLTLRQQLVLKYLIIGYSNGDIGKTLNISVRTVETHVNQIKDKLNARYRKDIIKTAILSGCLTHNFANNLLSDAA